jgi:hypothetical protein
MSVYQMITTGASTDTYSRGQGEGTPARELRLGLGASKPLSPADGEHAMSHRLATCAVVAILALTACGGSTPTSSGGAGSGSAIAASGAPTPSPATSPPPTTDPDAGGPSGSCPATVLTVHLSGAGPANQLCVRVGARIDLVADPAAGERWMGPIVSDNSTLVCPVPSPNAEGWQHASCFAHRPGVVEVLLVTAPGPDPHGPPQRRWHATISVQMGFPGHG